jgi:DNA-binding NarL/FixJ family response regulator
MNALIVDDQGLIRESLVLSIQLLKPELEIYKAGTLVDAKKILSERSIDFIFLDIDMKEEEDGLLFLKKIKEDGNESRVIMLSNQDAPETVLNAIQFGAVGFVTKNAADISPLENALDLILRGGVYLPDHIRGRRGITPPPGPLNQEQPIRIRKVDSSDLNVPPRVYETLFYISNGLPYKTIASKMSITQGCAEEFAGTGFQKLHVRGKIGFMVMLNKNGWQLVPPPSHRLQEVKTNSEPNSG